MTEFNEKIVLHIPMCTYKTGTMTGIHVDVNLVISKYITFLDEMGITEPYFSNTTSYRNGHRYPSKTLTFFCKSETVGNNCISKFLDIIKPFDYLQQDYIVYEKNNTMVIIDVKNRT